MNNPVVVLKRYNSNFWISNRHYTDIQTDIFWK